MWGQISHVKPSNCFRRLGKLVLPSIFDIGLLSLMMWNLQSYPTTILNEKCDILGGQIILWSPYIFSGDKTPNPWSQLKTTTDVPGCYCQRLTSRRRQRRWVPWQPQPVSAARRTLLLATVSSSSFLSWSCACQPAASDVMRSATQVIDKTKLSETRQQLHLATNKHTLLHQRHGTKNNKKKTNKIL